MQSAGVVVRQAQLDDAAAIARIYNQGIEDRVATFETLARTVDQIADLLRDRGDAYPTIVVEMDGEIVAWAGSSAYSTRPCYAGIAEFSMYTERAARGKGYGRAALEGLLQSCESHGFWKVLSRVFVENVASRALCQRTGFREVGILRRHAKLDGEWRDCVIVERLLGDALR